MGTRREHRVKGGRWLWAALGVLAVMGCSAPPHDADVDVCGCGEPGCEASCEGDVLDCACDGEAGGEVCGADGQTYSSACAASCVGVAVASGGACQALCASDADCDAGRVCTAGTLDCLSPPGCDGGLCGGACHGRCIEPGCGCSQLSAPVCGADGVTYANECQARCVGAVIARYEACEVCPAIEGCGLECAWGYALDVDGCAACACEPAPQLCVEDSDCEQAQRCDPEACAPSCPTCDDCNPACVDVTCRCPDEASPVCGADGVTYPNPCEAGCADVAVVSQGACEHVCAPIEGCALECPWGKRRDDHGCTLCACADPPALCETSRDCVEGAYCDPAACAPSCPTCEDCNPACTPHEACGCQASDAPVCGLDGVTYPSACEAACAEVGVAAQGGCGTSACVCEASTQQPACGADGELFASACDAACAGVGVSASGTCDRLSACACPWSATPVCGEDARTYSCEQIATCLGVEARWLGSCEAPLSCTEQQACPEGARCELEGCARACPTCPCVGFCLPYP